MHVTLVELEFVELPDVPDVGEGQPTNNGYLLSMWDGTCRLATWKESALRFEDSGGLLNPLAVRSWATLDKPLDRHGWGEHIARAAIAGDTSYEKAGWLEPTYEPR